MAEVGDLVVAGRIHGAFGIKGWLKVESFTEDPDRLLEAGLWWLSVAGAWQSRRVLQGQRHGRGYIVELEGCADRDSAERMRGTDVGLPLQDLPVLAEDEHYWFQLLGFHVVSVEGDSRRTLGVLADVMATGANDVMVVQAAEIGRAHV